MTLETDVLRPDALRSARGKSHGIDDRLESPSTDSREILGAFAEAEEEVTTSSEREGSTVFDLAQRNAFGMVAGHRRVCRRLTDGDGGPPSAINNKETQS